MMPLHEIFSPPGTCPDSTILRKAASGNLEDAELHALEAHLLDCDTCAEALEGLKKTPGAAEILDGLPARYEALRNISTPNHSSKTIWRTFLRIAAVAIPIALAVAWWQWPATNDPSASTSLATLMPYEKFSGGLDLLPTFRSAVPAPQSEDPKAVLRQAILAYERNSWDTARTLFQEWQKIDTQSVISPLFLGLCDLEDKQTESAIRHLELAYQSGLLPEISSWYLSQAYWMNGQAQKARPLLEYLVQRKSIYERKASKLLSILSAETKDR